VNTFFLFLLRWLSAAGFLPPTQVLGLEAPPPAMAARSAQPGAASSPGVLPAARIEADADISNGF
jgi:hypothetical protein